MFRAASTTFLAALALLAAPIMAAEWRYTDGAGKTVVLPDPPQRIIAHSTVAAALIPYGIRPVGILRDGPPSLDRSLDGVDISGIPIVSRGWFEIDAEAVLNLDPDLIVTEYSLAEGVYQGGTHEDAIARRLETIAPIVGVPRSNSIAGLLEDYRVFAQGLGADMDRPDLTADKARLESAVTDLQATLATKPGLTVMAVSPSSQSLSIALPDLFGELHDLRQWGIDLLSPPSSSGTSYLTLSWESAQDYQADIILLDDRWAQPAIDVFAAHPLGDRFIAIQAGQVGNWPAEWIRSYAVYANEIEGLTALIARSNPDLVDESR